MCSQYNNIVQPESICTTYVGNSTGSLRCMRNETYMATGFISAVSSQALPSRLLSRVEGRFSNDVSGVEGAD